MQPAEGRTRMYRAGWFTLSWFIRSHVMTGPYTHAGQNIYPILCCFSHVAGLLSLIRRITCCRQELINHNLHAICSSQRPDATILNEFKHVLQDRLGTRTQITNVCSKRTPSKACFATALCPAYQQPSAQVNCVAKRGFGWMQ